jgi:phosphoribosylformylglycinamidine synthase
MSIASDLGMKLNLSFAKKISTTNLLFSESQSRIVVSIKTSMKKEFEKVFKNQSCALIGKTKVKKYLSINIFNEDLINIPITDLSKAYKKNIENL